MLGRIPLACLLTALLAADANGQGAPWEGSVKAGQEAYQRGHYRDAERLLEDALTRADEAKAGDAVVAAILCRLGEAHLEQGRYGEANRTCGRAEEIFERLHGPDHADVARCLNERAEAHRRLGIYGVAARLARRALAIREKALRPADLQVAESLETLARVDLERFAEGVEQYETRTHLIGNVRMPEPIERARVIREKALGKDHPDVLPNLLVWAAYYLDDGEDEEKRAKAERCLRQALDLTRKVHGDDHPATADCLAELARAYAAQRKYAGAETAQGKALAIWKQALGPQHPRVGDGLWNLATFHLAQGRSAQADALFTDAVRYRFAGLRDADLCHFFRLAAYQRNPWLTDTEEVYEAYLTEMVRRGGPAIETCLREWDRELRGRHGWGVLYEDFRRRAASLSLPYLKLPYGDDRLENLEVFTALRRVQGKPDPLPVLVRGPAELECVFPELPTLAVSLRNRDAERRTVGFTEGGNYRTGRQERWRFQVYDARGQRLPVKDRPSGEAGGIFGRSALRYGEGWNTSLQMRSFVEVAEPGEYQVRILYHDSIEIAAEGFVSGRILCRSPVLRLNVKRRVIELSGPERAELQKWLGALDEKGPVQVVGGPYGEWAHDVVPPNTPAGRVLTAGWKAVPVLLDALSDERFSEKKRAWFLALLLSITGGHDSLWYPSEVLGAYQSVQAPWAIWGNRDGTGESGGSAFREESSGKGKIDGVKQRAFARRWLAWKQYLDVRATAAGERNRPEK